MNRFGIELGKLMENHLSDILFSERSNREHIHLYRTDDYWVAFERSAFHLCHIYAKSVINAGILFFLPFVMGFQRPCRVALVLLKPQNCVLCHSAPFPIPFPSGVFHRENPAENSSDRIGMDRI